MTSFTFLVDEIEALTRELMAIRSYPGEEQRAQLACADWLRAAGMQPELQPTRSGQPNVLARIENGPGKTLLLNGHMDTVLAVDGWERDPWQGWRDGDLLYGLGAADMKSGVALNMLVARALATNKSAWRGTLIFSSVTDEEALSIGARTMMDAGMQADACIVTEPLWDGGSIGGAGKMLVRADVTGKAAHGFTPWEGINAGIEAARFAAGVGAAVPPASHPLVPASTTVLSIHAGSPAYVITLPETAEVLVTRQLVPGEQRAAVIAQMEAFAASLASPARFAFSTPEPYYAPWAFDAPDHPFTQAFVAAYHGVRGEDPALRYFVGITDANVICGDGGIPCIVFGARGGAFHQCQEWVDLPSVSTAAQIVAQAAVGFLRPIP